MLRRGSIRVVLVCALFCCAVPHLVVEAQLERKKAQPLEKAKKEFGKAAKGVPAGLNYWAPPNQLIAIDEVQRDLKLDAAQEKAVKKVLADYQDDIKGGAAGGKFADVLKKQQDATQKLNDALKAGIGDKMKRLDQIAAQGAGLPAYFTPARKEQLDLSDEQLAKGKEIVEAAVKEMQEKANKDGQKLTVAMFRNPEQRTTFIDNATPKLLTLLSKDQNKKFLDLIGDPLQPEALNKVRTGTANVFGPGFGNFNPGPGGFNPAPGGKGKGKGGFDAPPTLSGLLGSYKWAFGHGSYRAAEELARKALDLAKEPTVQRGEWLVAHGAVLCQLGRDNDAETQLKEALAIYEKQVGPLNPRNAAALAWLGNVAGQRGQLDKAETFQRKALDIYEKVEGPNAVETAHVWSNLGNLAVQQKKLAEAEKHQRKALEIREKALGKTHPLTGLSLHHLGVVYREMGKTKEAEEHGLRALEIFRQDNTEHGDIVLPLRMLTDLCIQQKRWQDAEKHARAWLRFLETDRVESMALTDPLDRLATILTAAGRADEAAAINQRKQGLKDKLANQKPATP